MAKTCVRSQIVSSISSPKRFAEYSSLLRRTAILSGFAVLIFPLARLHAIEPGEPPRGTDRTPTASQPAPVPQNAAPVGDAREHSRKFARGLDEFEDVFAPQDPQQVPLPARVDAATRLLFRLHSLPANDRYELLKAWTLPTEGRDTVRSFIGLLADAPPPGVFMKESLPPLDDPLVSTVAMLVDAAREAGKLEELRTDIEPLVDRNCDGAIFLANLLDAAQQRGPNTRVRLSLLLDEKELTNQLTLAKQSANFSMVLWQYRARAMHILDHTPGVSLKPTSDPGLKHWVPVDLSEGANCNPFSSTSWWVALDDRVGHVCSPWIDNLVFAYPLEGTFQISAEPYNDFWSEGNLGFGGIVFEAYNQGTSQNQIYPISRHEVLTRRKPPEVKGFNRVTIDVEPNRLRVSGNDDLMFDDKSPSPTGPFLVLRTTWLSAFRKLRITGQPVIPREVALLSGQRMDGWVSSFYNESQPPELTIRQKPDSGVTRNNDPDGYDWSTNDGVLHGRRFTDLNSPNRQTAFQHGESWLYYHRPLREGDRVSYEYFYQPGNDAIEIHPTFDRLAFLLHPEGVQLHWLTTNRAREAGSGWIATDNVVEEPANRRGPKKLPLKVNAWNQVTVEVQQGIVHLSLNGELIYERKVESHWGSRFGLYHDRTRTSVRVRNVLLTGNWPQWSPELAANLLEQTVPQAPIDKDAIRSILAPRLTTND